MSGTAETSYFDPDSTVTNDFTIGATGGTAHGMLDDAVRASTALSTGGGSYDDYVRATGASGSTAFDLDAGFTCTLWSGSTYDSATITEIKVFVNYTTSSASDAYLQSTNVKWTAGSNSPVTYSSLSTISGLSNDWHGRTTGTISLSTAAANSATFETSWTVAKSQNVTVHAAYIEVSWTGFEAAGFEPAWAMGATKTIRPWGLN